MELHELQCHFHEDFCSIKLAASAAPAACLNSGFSSFYRFFNMLLWPDPLITTLSLPSHSMLKIDLG
jgi:hypothetical protein